MSNAEEWGRNHAAAGRLATCVVCGKRRGNRNLRWSDGSVVVWWNEHEVRVPHGQHCCTKHQIVPAAPADVQP